MSFVPGQTSSGCVIAAAWTPVTPARFWDGIFFPSPATAAIAYPGATTTATGSGDEPLKKLPDSALRLLFLPEDRANHPLAERDCIYHLFHQQIIVSDLNWNKFDHNKKCDRYVFNRGSP